MQLLTTLEHHVLVAIVALHSQAYGISIQDYIERNAGYKPSVGALYAALDRLRVKGFVRSRQGESTPERGGRRKLYFSLTAPGLKALKESRNATLALWRAAGLQGALA